MQQFAKGSYGKKGFITEKEIICYNCATDKEKKEEDILGLDYLDKNEKRLICDRCNKKI